MAREITMADFKKFFDHLEVDKFDLHNECGKQASLYGELVELHAKANDELGRAKTNIDVTKSQLDLKIRKEPDEYGIHSKITEGAVRAAIESHEDHEAAMERFQEAKKMVDIASGLREALNHKKHSLDNMVKLFLSAYYGDPVTAPKIEKHESEQKQARTRDAMHKHLNTAKE